MKLTNRLVAVTTVVITLAHLAATSATAEMSQSQSFSSSTSVTTKCENGNCGNFVNEVKTNMEGSQSQYQVSGGQGSGGGNSGYAPRHRNRVLTTYWVDDRPQEVEHDGKVLIKWWDWKGGTCHVRYNEANQSGYKYNTSTACDDGSITVGGLVPGHKYRFQVKKDDGGWSRAFVAVAK